MINEMKVNYLTEPLGIETTGINFSWQLVSSRMGTRQTAFQIQVWQEETQIWDSGVVSDDRSVAIPLPQTLENATAYHWQVRVIDELQQEHLSPIANFETGVTDDPSWQNAPFIALEQPSEIAPTFIYQREIEQPISQARLYITALGVYTLAVNGEQVDRLRQTDEHRQFLNPGYGNKDISLSYQTYDLTTYLQAQTSFRLAIQLGNGWYNGMATTKSAPAVKALFCWQDEAGNTYQQATDLQNWQGTLAGSVIKNGIYFGEDYDGNRLSLSQLSQIKTAFPVETLTTKNYPGEIFSAPGLNGKIVEKHNKSPKELIIYEGLRLDSDMIGDEVKVEQRLSEEELRPVTAENTIGIQVKRGQTLQIDFGQNMTAIPKIIFHAQKGTKLTARFGEMLNDGRKWDDKPNSQTGDGPAGSIYFKNLRNARAAVTYIANGSHREVYQPTTSFFGYQYMSLEADNEFVFYYSEAQHLSSISDQTGTITTNNKDVNRLVENVLYGQLSNYFTTATDCPQRDERLFWSGDTQAFIQTALYNVDSYRFLGDLQKNMIRNTLIKGYVPMVVDSMNDEYFSTFCAGWSDALVIDTWTLYGQTGDRSFLAESFPAMEHYYRFLRSHERSADAGPVFGDRNCGDWLSVQGTNIAVIADYYYAYVVQLLAKIAGILDEPAKKNAYQEKFRRLKAAFLNEHVLFENDQLVIKSGDKATARNQFFGEGSGKKGGSWENNSQTALLWFLKLDFATDQAMKLAAVDLLLANIRNEHPKTDSIRFGAEQKTLAVGFLGVNVLAPVLTQLGASELAYDLLLQTKQPSWLFEVKNGATTVWERWNSYDRAEGFGDSEMNSFNHYAYGSIVEWLYMYVLGITWDEQQPGFKRIILQPTFDSGKVYNEEERINQIDGTYQSLYGEISVAWQFFDHQFSYQVTIPANTSACLFLPIPASWIISKLPTGITYQGRQVHNGNDTARFELLAGTWDFRRQDSELFVSDRRPAKDKTCFSLS